MSLSPQFLEELRSRTSLSALIGRSIKVTKAGREYKACCPFHNEKSPSFTINDEKGFYHCFGCSAHGDAIRWMTDQRGLGFMDAVKELADAAGMQVPAPDPQAAKRAEKANNLYDVMAAAQDFFQSKLGSIDGNQARDYLEKRGITPKTISDFGIGYSPDSRSALREALKQFGDEMLVEAGLLIKVDDKEPYDRFRGRLMIPIRDARGRVIAFGGRILGAGEPKYLNSPDTPLFDKGRTLYNLDKASPASRASNRVIVVEGYMDVIALSQAGFTDAVAPLGTALTEQQIVMLWRMVPKPILCFDGDNAGQKASERACLIAIPNMTPGTSFQVAILPPGQDPDDLIKGSGPTAFKFAVDSSKSLAAFLWSRQRASISPIQPDPDDRARLLENLELLAKQFKDEKLSRQYLLYFRRQFFDEFGFKRDSVHRASRVIGEAVHANLTGIRQSVHRAILLGLSRYPRVIEQKFEEILKIPLENPNLIKMRETIISIIKTEPSIEQDIIEQIWATELNPPFKPRDLQHDLAYSFYKKHVDRTKPESDLFLLIGFVNAESELDKIILETREKFNGSFDEDAANQCRQYENQRREIRQRLSDMAANKSQDAVAA
jgi:DNA primase